MLDGGNYHKDIAILWAAHKANPFYCIDPKSDQRQFASEIEEFSRKTILLVAEDRNPAFENGRGPVCFIGIHDDGWKVEPHMEFFPWATKKNILRVTVSFLQWIRYKQIGVCIVKSLEVSKNLFDRCRDYGVLFYAGKIIGGDPRGDEYIYSIMGKKNPTRDNPNKRLDHVEST